MPLISDGSTGHTARMQRRRIPRRARRRVGVALLVLVIVPVLGIAAIEARLWAASRGAIYREVAATPHRRVAIVFGAQVLPGGRPSNALAYRLDAAIALYRAGRVERLLLTGDHGTPDYDEPGTMRAYAVARGVPDGAIAVDYAGFRTYDSCYRARAIFGVDEALLVTQDYHLPRALYTCAGLGVRAVGFAAQPFVGPNARAARWREHPARWVAWWQVAVTRPEPRYLGPHETAVDDTAAPAP